MGAESANVVRDILIHLFNLKVLSEIFSSVIPCLGVTAITYGTLQAFMKREIHINYPAGTKNPMSGHATWLIITAVFIPVSLLIFWWYSAGMSIATLMFPAGLSFAFAVYHNFKLRGLLRKESPHIELDVIVVNEAFSVLGDTIVDTCARAITKFGSILINVIMRTVHHALVDNYMVVSLALNIAVSFMITAFMNSSAAAGTWNLVGSAIGGLLHYYLTRDLVRKLSDKYKADAKKVRKRAKSA